MTLFVGTSGWQYPHWRGAFYPERLAQHAWLEHYAERFRIVEVNRTFYRLPEAVTFADWAARTPDDFVFALKMSRYLTHVKRLREPAEPVDRFLERASRLGRKLGPVLLQLPPGMRADVGRLGEALSRFPREVKVAVEFRDASWDVEEVRRLLGERGAALCLADRQGPLSPSWRTADWTYVRMHEGLATPAPCYGARALGSWTTRIAATWGRRADAYVFFNNDARACALRDAGAFARAAFKAGLEPTRVPAAREVLAA